LLITAASMTSPASSGVDSLRTVTVPSADVLDAHVGGGVDGDRRSVERKSPPSIVATWVRESLDHSPIGCGCLRA
jgi:hypothetical protein